jgi:hypothetical protein
MGRRGVAHAQEYSWDKIAERMSELYEEVLMLKNPRPNR